MLPFVCSSFIFSGILRLWRQNRGVIYVDTDRPGSHTPHATAACEWTVLPPLLVQSERAERCWGVPNPRVGLQAGWLGFHRSPGCAILNGPLSNPALRPAAQVFG